MYKYITFNRSLTYRINEQGVIEFRTYGNWFSTSTTRNISTETVKKITDKASTIGWGESAVIY